MPSEPEEEQPRIATYEEAQALIDWLHSSPPYELVGRVVCEASAVEAGLIQCAHQAGTEPDRLRKMQARDLLRCLRRHPHPDSRVDRDLLKRVSDLLKIRDVLAHGAPMNRFGYGDVHGFVKHNRETGEGYEWFGLTEEELTTAARDLTEIGEVLQSVVLRFEDRKSRGEH